MFRLNADNSFPVDASMQVYLTDDNYMLLDSLFQPNQLIIASGTPGPAPDFKVQSPTRKITDIRIEGDRLDHLGQTSYLIIRATLSTANAGSTVVRFYSDYELGVKLGVRAKFKFE